MIAGFLTIGILQTMAVISPGPDFALVVKNTLGHSRRTGVLTALGITSGILFHMTYCLLGFAILISESKVLFDIVKYTGAAYLIYIGLKGLFSKDSKIQTVNTESTITAYQAYKQGLLCNMLNPKASLFFLGLFTLVINPKTPFIIQIGYGLEIMIITFIWFGSLSYMLTHGLVQSRIQSFQHIITKLMSVLLIIFGAILFLASH